MNLSKIVTVVLMIVFFGYLIFFAPKVERPTQSTSATISGVVTNHIGDTIKFYAPDSTYITVLDTVTGNFSIEFDWDTTASVSFFHGMESTKMYLQPGDDIKLTIDTEQFDESISYEGSDESSYYAWQYITNENSDFPNISEAEDNVLDSLFDEYYKPFLVKAESFKESNFIFYNSILDGIEGSKEYILNRRSALAALPQPGEAAIDFTYPDKDGNDVALSDFVGSVVYVDVWATWCGPCRTEMPFLHDLEAEYSDKNVTFIGVSVDVEKNRQVWLDMMEEKDMKGVQIFADGWSQITKDYAINGIPRFMLFDTEGNVSNLNADRPSSDDIRPALDALLVE
ncbi:MAG: TlpA disulfide reductase family protein [Bacteroidetes bacterium]|nr:TlpA disulfide reductase family protein [Bacteroidota bacterium]MDA0981316.1 TlpA disulfide reductase family protein [Bacteroidota bacterium]